MSVWDSLFDEDSKYEGHVKIVLKEQGIAYEGYIDSYSASLTGKKEICLKDVVKYDLETKQEIGDRIGAMYLQIRDDEDVILEILS